MPRIEWTEPAYIDLDTIEAHLDDIDPGIARTLADRTIRTADGLAEFPHRFSPPGRRKRVIHVDRTDYRIGYRVADKTGLLRIRHAREDWRR